MSEVEMHLDLDTIEPENRIFYTMKHKKEGT